MLNRRNFVSSLAAGTGLLAAAGGAAAPSEKRRVFVLENYYLKNGTQPARIHEYIEKAGLPALRKWCAGPHIVMEALSAPHMPQVAAILAFQSVEELWAVREKALGDEELSKAVARWEDNPEPPYEHFSTSLLEAAPYCPEVKLLEPRATPRVIELRTYHSPTWKQLQALHERFAGAEIQIFHRVGVHPILYSSTVFGQQMPNLTYVIPFDDLAAREKAWNAFSADPEWVKVRRESIDKHGQISSVMQISIWRATPYSPVR
jgi:hypothetical protein